MVLEERIAVSSEDAAKEIVRYLKKENIPARIFTEPRMNVALILAGQHEDLAIKVQARWPMEQLPAL